MFAHSPSYLGRLNLRGGIGIKIPQKRERVLTTKTRSTGPKNLQKHCSEISPSPLAPRLLRFRVWGLGFRIQGWMWFRSNFNPRRNSLHSQTFYPYPVYTRNHKAETRLPDASLLKLLYIAAQVLQEEEVTSACKNIEAGAFRDLGFGLIWITELTHWFICGTRVWLLGAESGNKPVVCNRSGRCTM